MTFGTISSMPGAARWPPTRCPAPIPSTRPWPRPLKPRRCLTTSPIPKAVPSWRCANAGEAGLYRQHPDGTLLAALLAHRDRLAPREQMGLLDDQWALARNGSQSMRVFLDVLAALAAGDHYQVLAQVVARLHTLERLLEQEGDTGTPAGLRRWVASAFAPKLAALGFAPRTGESRNAAQARVAVLGA